MSDKIICTVMTPTYNRGYKILDLYKSLQEQTNKNFEWIVVDDGSTDNTEDLFKEILKDKNDFKIFYYKIENGGKHRAINYALDRANGKYFFIVDSDDKLPKESIEIIFKWFKTIETKNNFAGIGGLRKYDNTGKIIGKTFKEEYVDCTSLERNKFNILGDKAEVFYTEILKKYKFPTFENEKFLSEAVVWNKIARDGLKIRWFNEATYEGNYLEDGLTKNLENHYKKSPKGFALYLKSIGIKNEKYKKIYLYLRCGYYYSIIKTFSIEEIAKEFEVKKYEIYLGYILYKMYKIFKEKK